MAHIGNTKEIIQNLAENTWSGWLTESSDLCQYNFKKVGNVITYISSFTR